MTTTLLSAALVLVGGFAAGWLVERIKLPRLLGMMLFGILVGPSVLGLLSADFLQLTPTVSLIALMTVITSSFFAIDLDVLRRNIGTVGLVGTIPGLMEGFAVLIAATLLLGFSWSQGGILGFTIAIVSPAVVVPTMIRLKESGWGMDKGIPVISLAATNLDGIMAIILWTVFMTIELGGGDVISAAGGVVLRIVLGVVFGLGTGYLVTRAFDRYLVGKAFWLRAALFLLLSVLVFLSSQVLPINGPMALLVFGLYVVNTTKVEMRQVGEVVKHLWAVAAIFLFVMIGAAANLDLVLRVGLVGLLVIGIGVLARIVGAYIALNLTKSDLNNREKLFIGLSTLGKATVQATLAPLVVALGVENGEIILAIAVMSILVMAPLSTLLIEFTYRRLLNRAEPDGAVEGFADVPA
jgi:NhaP-type Na+/H+ or K+/H+ antiporter